jgi:hypothetical protein
MGAVSMSKIPVVAGVRRATGRSLPVAVLVVAAVLAVGASGAGAVVVVAAPTWPISGAAAGPPPIAALSPAAQAQPPAEEIADPVTASASCSGWYLQSKYGDRWPAGSTWWEYRCSREDSYYYTNCGGGGACQTFCWDCYWETTDWTDYFYWDGWNAVFYGEAYSYSIVSEGDMFPPSSSAAWWDAPTARWYSLSPYSLTVSKAGSGSGEVSSSPAGIACGYACVQSFDAGTTVTLTATPDASATFSGWSGDCSGTDTCEITIDQARSVTPTFARDVPPLASFTATCTGLTCSLDGSGSTDPDDPIAAYAWDFGDGTLGSGQKATHTYPHAGSYSVRLTATDNAGATGSVSKTLNPISLSARGYKHNGAQKVDLSWNGPSGANFDVYRNDTKIVTVSTSSYTDTVSRRSGSYRYDVCAPALMSCSEQVTVGF